MPEDRAERGGWSAAGAHGAVSCYRCGPRAVEIGKNAFWDPNGLQV